MVVIYEAGCLGYSLYRNLTEQRCHCKIIAPNSIPEKKGKKTDRQDAINNLNYYCSGLLRFVWIPDVVTESARESLRFRFQLTQERTSEKQKVQALLKRQDAIFTETKKAWTKKHYAWLKTVQLPEEARIVLDMRLVRIERLDKDVNTLMEQLMKLINSNEQRKKLYSAYISMTGIGPLGAVTWIFEGQDLNRFAHPGNLMSYLGLVPKKNSSAGKDPALSITKAGNSYLRYVTVCAARSYSDNRLMQQKATLEKYTPELKELIANCQSRLSKRYRDLRQNKKHGNKAKVAVARELCAFIWELAVKVLPSIRSSECVLEHKAA